MRLCMVGAGYVGLVSGACFSDFGHDVVCVDADVQKIDQLRGGKIPVFEPGLQDIVATNLAAGRLSFTTDLATSVAGADVVFLAVGTPSRRGDGHADLSYIYAAAKEVATAIRGSTVIVTKSTVPVGTGDEIERQIRSFNPDAQFSVVSNPEFMREGAAIVDFKRPDRVIIGTSEARAQDVMARVYRPLNLNQAPLMFTTRKGAELIKYAANAFLATKIAFINEMADLCEAAGADVQEVARGIGADNRIGGKFLHAGPGFGGSCFPKDTLALLKTAQDHAVSLRIVESVVASNDQRKRQIAKKVIRACGGSVREKTIGVLGLTFKPNTDDMREAPSLSIITALQDAGAKIQAYDPAGMEQASKILNDVDFRTDPYACAAGADALVVVTEWDAFRGLDMMRLKATMKSAVVVDLRNVYRRDEMEQAGFVYFAVGRADEAAPMTDRG